ncbi:HET-domain-containing protein [Hypoxylon rubiginosum]|uniref:HET-domain-containing protein n=1 Tax=Hypoxylon rubiginosum TaxID=110542 RepID=A0ACC0CNF4_9PEZI|nr:HET-domain-containing protein [Hypoxylon rubiginosum]
MIRLINVQTYELEGFPEESVHGKYAILSHRWSDDEVIFQDMNNKDFRKKLADRSAPYSSYSNRGFTKIRETCRLARDLYKLDYAWIDSCCINRDLQDERTAAINSMFRWYMKASVCIVYLFGHKDPNKFPTRDANNSSESWFKRGWTLQELLAPKKVHFYSTGWYLIGSKTEYSVEIEAITGIPERVIRNVDELGMYSIAQRMSWAAGRVTTEEEDTAYCLCGIFGIVGMRREYGLGHGKRPPAEEAFLCLQKNIIDESNDMSIFAWSDPECSESYNLLARSPKAFSGCGDITSTCQASKRTKIGQNILDITDITETPGAIHLYFTEVTIDAEKWTDKPYWDTMPVSWTHKLTQIRYVLFVAATGENKDKKDVGICLEKIAPSLFRRVPKLPLIRMHSSAAGSIQMDICHIAIDNGTQLGKYDILNFKNTFLFHPQVVIKDVWPSGWWDHAHCRLFQPIPYSGFFTLSIWVSGTDLNLEVLYRYIGLDAWSCVLLNPQITPKAKKALDELRVDQRRREWGEFERRTDEARNLTNTAFTIDRLYFISIPPILRLYANLVGASQATQITISRTIPPPILARAVAPPPPMRMQPNPAAMRINPPVAAVAQGQWSSSGNNNIHYTMPNAATVNAVNTAPLPFARGTAWPGPAHQGQQFIGPPQPPPLGYN